MGSNLDSLEFMRERVRKARIIIYCMALLSGYNLASVIDNIRFHDSLTFLILNGLFLALTLLFMFLFIAVKHYVEKKIDNMNGEWN